MNLFDKQYQSENRFAKSNPNYLSSMFGATDIKPLWLADMDYKVAEPITQEILRLAQRGNYSYEFIASDIFKAISTWNKKRNNLNLNPKSFIQVPGVLTGIALLVRELSQQGDGVLIQSPVYHQFYQLIKTADREVIDSPLTLKDDKYTMDFDSLEANFKKEKVKLMILCNPHNPVGRVWTKEELQRLLDLANQYNVTIVSDEIHSDIIYQPNRFQSIAGLENSDNHVALIGSPAKTFGMQSISNGYIYISNTELHKKIKSLVASMYLDHGNAITSYATLAAYKKGEQWLEGLLSYLTETIDWIVGYMEKEIPQVKLTKPEGTYQIWMDFSRLGFTDEQLKQVLVEKAELALTPGEWFGDEHTQKARINIASPKEDIRTAFNQLKHAVLG